MDIGKQREEAVALNAKGVELLDKISKGEEPFEKYAEGEAWIKEAGEKMELAKTALLAEEQRSYLEDGEGSLTAAPQVEVPEPGDTKAYKWGLPEAPSAKEFVSLGEFALAVLADADPSMQRTLFSKGIINEATMDLLHRHDHEAKLLMQEGLGAAGGFLVPVPYLAELFYKAWERSIVRPRARIIPMSTRQIQLPTLDQTVTPANQKSAFFAGVNCAWIEEGAQKPEVELLFKLVTLTVHELAAYLPVTNNLIEDSAISIDGLLRTILPAAMTDAEDWWFLNGNGAGVPQGVISAPCTIQIPRVAAGFIRWGDIMAMLHHFEPGNGVWVIQICAMEELLSMVDVLGNLLWIPNLRDSMPQRLMGYPIVWTEKVPALGTKGDIGLYDFGYYLIGDRRGPTLEMSRDYLFRYNQIAYRLSERVDGQPWLSAPVMLRPAGANTISPFVVLDTTQAQ